MALGGGFVGNWELGIFGTQVEIGFCQVYCCQQSSSIAFRLGLGVDWKQESQI